MPNFKEYNQNQPMLLPPDIRDIIPPDHICYAINDVVERLDISSVKSTYLNDAGGSAAYAPSLLIKVMFYAYSVGVRSSRLIEKRCREDVVFRYLTAGVSPDHGTINLFRKNHLVGLESLFIQIVMLCGEMNMADFSDISIDGSIFKASASKKNTFNRKEIKRWRERIRKILLEAERIDKKENKKYGEKRGYDQMPANLADPETRQKEIKRLLTKMNRLKIADEKIQEKQEKVKNERLLVRSANMHNNHNIVDADANLMKLKNTKAVRPGYNGQIAASRQIITAYDVTMEAIDEPSLTAMINKTEKNTNKKVKTVKADCGYWSKDNMDKIEKTEIDAYIPDRRKEYEEKSKKDDTLDKYHRNYFKYDKKADEFICPEGKRLKMKITNRDRDGKILNQRYFCEHGNGCPKKAECAKAKRKQICVDWKLERYKTKMRKKLNSAAGKRKYVERMSEVEPVFGNIKHNQKAENFLCRGKPMVKIEFGLTCIAHNFVKIANWIKREPNKQQFEILMKSGALA